MFDCMISRRIESLSFPEASIESLQESLNGKGNAMAVGWSKDGAIQDQIDASVDDAVKRARSRLSEGESAAYCEHCEEPIPEARRKAVPGVRLCVHCQSNAEKDQTQFTGYNRRGSKDSQLK
jgi:phage/conjugal plasmid C-4 type zinc finger TraR family protein